MEENSREQEPKQPVRSSEELQEMLESLEKEWHSITKSSLKAKPKRPIHRSGSLQELVLNNDSPRQLMSALQYQTALRRSPSFSYLSPVTFTGSSGEIWRVRDNELAKEETRRERKLAFKSGKIRGRRLFEGACQVDVEEDEEISNVSPETFSAEEGKPSSCLSDPSYGSNETDDESSYYEKTIGEGEQVLVKEVKNEARKVGLMKLGGLRSTVNGFGERLVVLKLFIAVGLMAFVLGIIGPFDRYGSEVKVDLLPT